MPSDPMQITFGGDTTFRWACRTGDFLLWLRVQGLFGGGWSIEDLWRLHDGDSVLLTNRLGDMPPWFEPHPTEVCGAFKLRLHAEWERGTRQAPTFPVDAPNLWRMQTGDRLAWVGRSRPDIHTKFGVLAVVEFETCALVTGEPAGRDIESFMSFGDLERTGAPNDLKMCRNGITAASRAFGDIRSFATAWLLDDDQSRQTHVETLSLQPG